MGGILKQSGVLLAALMLFAVACSGGDDAGPSPEEIAADPDNAPAAAIDSGSGGVAEGPVKGLLTVQPSFGFGVWDVDRATGQASAIPGIASVATVDRNRDLLVSGGAAYAIGGTPREGQSFASDLSVVKIDYATGQVRQLVALGFDRETDDSETLNSFVLEAVAGNNVVVSSGEFGGDERTFTVYDAATGDEKASFPRPFYEFSADGGSCSGTIGNVIGLSDGRLAGVALGSPAFVDAESGEIELAIGCDVEDPELDDFITTSDVNDYAVFAEGPAPTTEQLEWLIDTDIEPRHGFVEGGGDLWWIDADSRTIDDVRATLGGVVQFDLETNQIEAVHPLGARLAEYVDCAPDSESCEVTTMAQAQMRFIGGRLVILDTRDNGRLMTLDPASSTITTTELTLGDGVDYTSAELLDGDPNAVWLEVRRMTIVQDDDAGFRASGPSYIEHFDLASNQIDLSIDGQDLFF